ncbi:cysteine desulfurase [Halogranum amylolyticum]|uniref:cysteine desulfurase n=1 Tax=Halogranum amylolyticum TaxID=660520 RepID=A0A1H8W781_9EURY|nr:cysteine desulfurase family protein [Halogranum amylolyticum]SEP22988.1 cysteine desulfurase [Halogranum amylolyticum]
MPEELSTPIYLDHHATTPVDERVLSAFQPYFTEQFGNPASVDHSFGAEAKRGVKRARKQLANAFGTRPEEFIFTSGATESDNLAIRGAAEYAINQGDGSHIITTVTEHDAVLEPCEHLEDEGFDVTYLPVDEHGRVDVADVADAIREETILVSIMAANNEIGTYAPLAEIGELCKAEEVLFHTDAVQAVGYRELDVDTLGVDLLSLSGHKIYGPKGIGALYVRRRRPKVHLKPLLLGGGQERGWRSGTLNVPGIVGLGEAVRLADSEREARVVHARELTDLLWELLTDELDNLTRNGHPTDGLPNNLNVSFGGVENKALVKLLQPEIAVSAGSACTTGSVEASHVLQAITDDESRWHSSIRFGIGKDTTEREIQYTAEEVTAAVSRLRKLQF